MRNIVKLSILTLCAILLYILFKLDLLNGNMDSLNQLLHDSNSYKEIIFITLSSVRVLALIPSTVFMILGGIIFNPWEGFILTLISVILSETAIFFISKFFLRSSLQSYLIKKYPKLNKLLLKNNVKILSIGILCPIAPSDIACFLASSSGLSYRKFIITVTISNMPMILLYSFLGTSVMSSIWYSLLIISIILAICCYSTYLWKKAQKQHQIA